MSSGRYCLIRDLGLVKGGKGLRHHEVLVAFSLQAAWKRIRRSDFSFKRFNPVAALIAREVPGKLSSIERQ